MTTKLTIDQIRKSLPERERRLVPAKVGPIELRTDGEDPKITMHIPYGTRSEGLPFTEIVQPGAFKRSLSHQRSGKRSDVVALWNHDPNWVLGRQSNGTLTFDDGDEALSATAQLEGRDTMHQHFARRVERRDVQGSSFGFEKVKDTWVEEDDGTTTRYLDEVKLFDVSPVTYPVYPDSGAEARSVVDVAILKSGFDLSELASVLQEVKDGTVPEGRRSLLERFIARLERLMPTPPVEPIDWARKIALHARASGIPDVRAKTASVDGQEHPSSDFAYVPDPDKPSTWGFPVFDASHAQNALARWNQADIPAADKEAVKRKILAACHKFKIDTTAFEKEFGS